MRHCISVLETEKLAKAKKDTDFKIITNIK